MAKKITLVKSLNGRLQKHKDTAASLGPPSSLTTFRLPASSPKSVTSAR